MTEQDIRTEIHKTNENIPLLKSYKDFKVMSHKEIKDNGVIIKSLSPTKLWASQDWTDQNKVVRTISQDLGDAEVILPAYYYDMPKSGQRAIILANGHHHLLHAHEKGRKVSVNIIGPLPSGTDIMSFSRYRRETGDAFRGL